MLYRKTGRFSKCRKQSRKDRQKLNDKNAKPRPSRTRFRPT
jgi:hypothetical protein